jgi:hypothetical protein
MARPIARMRAARSRENRGTPQVLNDKTRNSIYLSASTDRIPTSDSMQFWNKRYTKLEDWGKAEGVHLEIELQADRTGFLDPG